ncbi:MAG: adenylyl-sulfate kinase [Crocinitomicaceae bacterium]|nr:adenylyl-sulfate kinase [Crocinitomicaceae bacterium]
MSNNVIHQKFGLSKEDRQKIKKHSSFLIWFTGLSGSGKSTLSSAVEQKLHKMSVHTYPLDGDNVRNGINKNLSFSAEDREENIRRVAEIAKLFIDAGVVVLGSFISPYKKSRAEIKKIVGEENFIEVYMNTSLEECERRDVKGLYKKARSGEISSFTGISDPYEAPESADVEIDTEKFTVEEAAVQIIEAVQQKLKLT